MSFGYGCTDILTTAGLAWKLYKSCKDAPDSFGNIAVEVLSLHAVLKEAEECLLVQIPEDEKVNRLRAIIQSCQLVLGDLDKLVAKHRRLGTQSRRTWDRMKWGTEDIAQLRTRITSNTLLLTTWISLSQARVQKKLEEFVDDYKRCDCAKSTISVTTMDSIISHETEIWRSIRKELEGNGISVQAFEENKEYIFQWLVKALKDGVFETQERSSAQSSIDELPIIDMEARVSLVAKEVIVTPVRRKAIATPTLGSGYNTFSAARFYHILK